MANPNVEIWGTPETWINAPIMGGTTGAVAETLQISNPKCPDFGTETNPTRLASGITSGRIIANEPLDLTICPCGQDESVSAYGKLAIFNEDGSLSLTPRVVERTSPVNWFMFDQRLDVDIQAENFKIYKDWDWSAYSGMRYDQWSPNATTDYKNPNLYISPYTFWYTRSILMSIQVGCFNSVSGSSVNFTWQPLDYWKNNYSNQSICAIRCFARSVNTFNSNTNTIEYVHTGLTQYNYGGRIGLLDPIPDIDNNGNITDTTFYSFLKYGNSGRISFLFAPTSSMSANSGIAILPCWEKFDGQTINKAGNSSAGYTYYYLIPYSDDTYDKIMKMVACFGCYFTPTDNYQYNYSMTSNDLCLPIIDENGIAHGEYTRGSDNVNNDLYDLSSIRDKNYDPSKQHDPNTYSNVTNFNIVTESAAMTRRYVLDAANVEKLGDDLWTICENIATGGDFEYFDGKLKNEFLTTNPIDCIISLMRFPFNVPFQLQPLQSYVKLGRSEGSAKGWITVFISNQINFKGVSIFPRFGNSFLDYEPFTTYELYIPFSGTTKIRAADILGHQLNVSMIIDLITGSCTAYIKADQLVIETVNGSCGVSQQISGIDTATMNANIYNGILNQKQAKTQYMAQAAGALMPSNWVNPVGYAAKGEQAETSYKAATYAIEHMETPVHNIGSASPLLGWIQEFDARLLIYYPEGDVIESTIPPSFKPAPLAAFGHLKGFATATPGTVSNFQMNGKAAYLSGDIIPDAIPCTLSERNRIKSMFADGVYLPPL